jgi:hypothetical protein
MPSKLAADPRIDPRIKALCAGWDVRPLSNVASREELFAIEKVKPAEQLPRHLKNFSTCATTKS